MTNSPKLIDEIQAKEWLRILLSEYHLDQSISPKLELKKGLYTHRYDVPGKTNFETFTAENFRIYESEYFKSVSIEFETRDVQLFENQDKYCANNFYPKSQTWHYSGSRMASYIYINNDTITHLIITQQSKEYIRVILACETIDKIAKKEINRNIKLKGKFYMGSSTKTFKIKDYSEYSDEEIGDLKKWKNIMLSKISQLVQIRMNNWIENLYECDIEDEEKSIRLIYVTLEQKEKIEKLLKDTNSELIKLDGEFRMFSDYTAILETINNIDEIKH